jgi:hypothetical protein
LYAKQEVVQTPLEVEEEAEAQKTGRFEYSHFYTEPLQGAAQSKAWLVCCSHAQQTVPLYRCGWDLPRAHLLYMASGRRKAC